MPDAGGGNAARARAFSPDGSGHVLPEIPAEPLILPPYLRLSAAGAVLGVFLQPRGSINQIVGPQGAELRVKVTAPPVDGAANAALVEYLAEMLAISRARVELVRGQASRHKSVLLRGLPPAAALQRLAAARSGEN